MRAGGGRAARATHAMTATAAEAQVVTAAMAPAVHRTVRCECLLALGDDCRDTERSEDGIKAEHHLPDDDRPCQQEHRQRRHDRAPPQTAVTFAARTRS